MDSKYTELATRIGMGDSERIPRLFSMIANDKEAQVLLALPADAPTLAAKFDLPREEIERMIHNLFVKGLVFPSFKTDPPTYRMGRDLSLIHISEPPRPY